MNLDFAGRRVLVTGSTTGIGAAVGRAFLGAGASVVFNSHLPQEEFSDWPRLLSTWKDCAYYIQADLAHSAQIKMLFKQAWSKLGGIDILINNVGTYYEPKLWELDTEDFHRVLNLNVRPGVLLTALWSKQALEDKLEPGTVIFTSSINATRSEPQHSLYDGTKGFIEAFVRSSALELAPYGHRVFGVAPGLIATPLTDNGFVHDPEIAQSLAQQIPLGRIGTPLDVATMYLVLASPICSYMTGVTIPINGGICTQQFSQRPITADGK